MRTIDPARAAHEPPPAASLDETGADLKRALHAWRDQCEAGAAALASGDTAGLEQALALREALRPKIEEIMGRLQRQSGATPALVADVRELGAQASAADARLTALLGVERSRLRDEIDTLRRGNGSVAAYRRPNAPNPHRLNIVR